MRLRQKAAGVLLLLLVLAAGVLVLLPGSHPALQDRGAVLQGTSAEHVAGTDALGRDRLLRSAAAMLLGLGGATLAAALTTAIAAAIGMLAASSPRPIRDTLLLLSDAFLTLPWLFLLMIVRSGFSLTSSPAHTAAVAFTLLALLGWPACARAVYAGSRRLDRSDAMLQGRAAGLRRGQLVRLHVLPRLGALLLPQFLVSVPAFVVAESNLGSLGLGIPEPLPSWGGMLAELNSSALMAQTHWVYLPIVLLVAVLFLLESMTAGRSQHAG